MDKKVVLYLLLGLFIGLLVGMFIWYHPSEDRYVCRSTCSFPVKPVFNISYRLEGDTLYITVTLDKWHPLSPIDISIYDVGYKQMVYHDKIIADEKGFYHGVIKIKPKKFSEQYKIYIVGYTCDCISQTYVKKISIR